MTGERTSGTTTEVLDLRGKPPPEQMQSAIAAVEQAVGGTAVRIVTDLDVVATYVMPAAAERGVRCRIEPPSEGVREMTLSPGARPLAATEPGSKEGTP